MEAIATELATRLAGALERLSQPGQRLLHVRCDAHTAGLAQTVVGTIARSAGACAVLRAPAIGAETEWGMRGVELAAWYAAQRRGEALPAGLLARPDAATFAAVLGAVAARVASDGLFHVVLAPRLAPSALDAVALVAIARALPEHVRLVCLETFAPDAWSGVAGVSTIDVRLEDERLRAAVAQRFDAMAAAPVDARGVRAAGGAGPRVAPPPRPSTMPESEAAVLTRRRAGEARQAFAALAAPLARGDVDGVLASSARAIGAMETAGVPALVTRLRLVRAGALAATGRREEALRECELARVAAVSEQDLAGALAARASQCGMVLAAGQLAMARTQYATLAVEAEAAGDVLLAAHALRARADLALRLRDPADAAAALDHAIGLGERAPRPMRALGPWAEVVRALTELCRRHGLHARAADAERRGRALAGALWDASDVERSEAT